MVNTTAALLEAACKRLKPYKKDKGAVGLAETHMSGRKLQRALTTLIEGVLEAKHLVAIVGAGISTDAGIPDFRGPTGIWTQEARDRTASCAPRAPKRPKLADVETPAAGSAAGAAGSIASASAAGPSTEPSRVAPTLTHFALAELMRRGILKCVVTQNVDALELQAGCPRERLSMIHGCALEERCPACGRRHLRDGDVGVTSGKPTGRACEAAGCGGALEATLLDWEDEWNEDEAELANEATARADYALVLGTSLRVEPAASLPLRSAKFGIVNLQETPKDRAPKCEVIVRAKTDLVMQALMRQVCGVELSAESEWVPL